jgi:hypothetical protein
MAGFGSSAPAGEMAGFTASRIRRCRPTVSRLSPSSRAMRRRLQPRSYNVYIESLIAILIWFAMLEFGSFRSPSYTAHHLIKVAGFHSPFTGWF